MGMARRLRWHRQPGAHALADVRQAKRLSCAEIALPTNLKKLRTGADSEHGPPSTGVRSVRDEGSIEPAGEGL